MVEHRSMAREIKNLDSDMQQLVYENYNKFISATDTIRSMKSNVDSMGVSMGDLKTIMGGWQHVSHARRPRDGRLCALGSGVVNDPPADCSEWVDVVNDPRFCLCGTFVGAVQAHLVVGMAPHQTKRRPCMGGFCAHKCSSQEGFTL